MSKGAVYYYFEDKADLFATAFQRSVERIAEEAGWPAMEIVPAEAYWETLLDLTRRSVALAMRNEWWLRLARSYHRFSHEAADSPAVSRIVDFAQGWWARIIRRGQELGLVRDDLPTELLVAIVNGADHAGDRWMTERWERFSREELDRMVCARVDLVRDMLSKEHQGWNR